MKFPLHHFSVAFLLAGLLLSGCITSQQRVALNEEASILCFYPYNPLNIIPVLVSYDRGLRYITEGPETCRRAFANRIKEVTMASFLLPKGCKDAVLKDVEDALNKRQQLKKKLGMKEDRG